MNLIPISVTERGRELLRAKAKKEGRTMYKTLEIVLEEDAKRDLKKEKEI